MNYKWCTNERLDLLALDKSGNLVIIENKLDDSEMTEDELKMAETEIQKITDKNIEEIDKILANKETEIMSV